MNRKDLQEITKTRATDAKTLMENNNFSGAYYLCGYIIECALKACIAKQVKQYDFPYKKTVVDSYTHDLDKLLKVAGLDTQLQNDSEENEEFGLNWNVVKDWSENSRYEYDIEEKKARDLFKSINDPEHGVLKWLISHW